MTRRKIQYWVIPPEADAEFAAHMEGVLETYAKPHDPKSPVVCMDEQPVQLVKETRKPIAATAKHARRVDYEYERAGTASIFMFTAALSGWREATARPTKTKVDWAIEMARLLDGRYKKCEKVILVCDNLNTHTKGAFYEAFRPEQARAYVRRIDFVYTPKHGSWLNQAEIAISLFSRQCLGQRRIGDQASLQRETRAWSRRMNRHRVPIQWAFTRKKARHTFDYTITRSRY